MASKVLFVDDELPLLQGVQRMMLLYARGDFNLEFAQGGQDALSIVQNSFCDVIVTDMRMPGMDGAELLDAIRHVSPDSVRIVLSGEAELVDILRVVSSSHQYLSKPVDTATLVTTLRSILSLKSLALDARSHAFVSGIGRSLPCSSAIYDRLRDELAKPQPSEEIIQQMISCDLGMTLLFHSLLTSSYLRRFDRLTKTHNLVGSIGNTVLKAIVHNSELLQPAASIECEEFIKHINNHADLIKCQCRDAVLQYGLSESQADCAELAGQLSFAGPLIVSVCGEKNSEFLSRSVSMTRALGAYLLGIWGYPVEIIESIAGVPLHGLEKFSDIAKVIDPIISKAHKAITMDVTKERRV